jgi:hypothetical protein
MVLVKFQSCNKLSLMIFCDTSCNRKSNTMMVGRIIFLLQTMVGSRIYIYIYIQSIVCTHCFAFTDLMDEAREPASLALSSASQLSRRSAAFWRGSSQLAILPANQDLFAL